MDSLHAAFEKTGGLMRINRLITTFLSLSVAAIALSACGGTAVNTNANANIRNANSNTAVLVNATATPASNTANANVTREEYDKNRANYEKDKGSSTIGQGANDSWLWFKTRTALLTTADLRESTINVDAVNDVITLKGTVASAAQKTKAEQVAKGIDGVKSVKNELKVAPNDSMTNTSGNSNTNRR
jgi:hyperosmotically inducible periplasmic protein